MWLIQMWEPWNLFYQIHFQISMLWKLRMPICLNEAQAYADADAGAGL